MTTPTELVAVNKLEVVLAELLRLGMPELRFVCLTESLTKHGMYQVSYDTDATDADVGRMMSLGAAISAFTGKTIIFERMVF